MVLLEILNGKKAGTSWVARHFPARVGRSSAADLALDEPGVWDEHLQLQLRPDRAIGVLVAQPALASVNGQTIREAVLHNGDVLELGSLRLRFGLSAARQRSLRPREILTWVALALVSLGQIALIYLLL